MQQTIKYIEERAAIVKRLPEFLKLYAEKMKKKEKEYQKMAEIAEQMTQIAGGQ